MARRRRPRELLTMRAVRHPLNPSQLFNIRSPRGDAVTNPEILIGRQCGGVNAPRARYLVELGVDDIQLVFPDVWWAVRHPVVNPRVIT